MFPILNKSNKKCPWCSSFPICLSIKPDLGVFRRQNLLRPIFWSHQLIGSFLARESSYGRMCIRSSELACQKRLCWWSVPHLTSSLLIIREGYATLHLHKPTWDSPYIHIKLLVWSNRRAISFNTFQQLGEAAFFDVNKIIQTYSLLHL